MNVVVQKFGGSSVADVEKVRKVAERVAVARREGRRVCVVVSAMGKTTDELLALAKKVSESPARRELDMLLTAGERISMALLAMALEDLGVPAVSFTGSQAGILTDDRHASARIVEVRPVRVWEELDRGRVVIVAGFQGVSPRKEVTTLGRGGSDTTAVALAASLGADCEIYSDVDGVYTADPRVVTSPRRLDEISYEEMQELARAGAKVLNADAVQFARERGIAIHARATAGSTAETVVRGHAAPGGRIAGVASQKNLALVEVPWGATRRGARRAGAPGGRRRRRGRARRARTRGDSARQRPRVGVGPRRAARRRARRGGGRPGRGLGVGGRGPRRGGPGRAARGPRRGAGRRRGAEGGARHGLPGHRVVLGRARPRRGAGAPPQAGGGRSPTPSARTSRDRARRPCGSPGRPRPRSRTSRSGASRCAARPAPPGS